MGELLPPSYLLLEAAIEVKKKGCEVITESEMKVIGKQAQLVETHLDACLRFLHDIGTIFHFSSSEKLKDFIVLNPQWLSKALACIVTAQEGVESNDGTFTKEDVPKIWSQYPIWQLNFKSDCFFTPLDMRNPTMNSCCFSLTCSRSPFEFQMKNGSFLVCSLKSLLVCTIVQWISINLDFDTSCVNAEKLWTEVEDTMPPSFRNYKMYYLPLGLFNRLQAKLQQYVWIFWRLL